MVADICRIAGFSSSGVNSEKDVYKCRRLLGAIMKLNEQGDLFLQLPHLDTGHPFHIRGSRFALILLVQVKFSSRVQISKLCKNEQIWVRNKKKSAKYSMKTIVTVLFFYIMIRIGP